MERLTVGKVQRKGLADQTADLLRKAIVMGKLSSATRLVETELSEQLEVSRGTLREALRVLELEGLVESFPGRGTYVANLSERDIQEVYSLRCILEEEAVRLVADKATPEQVGRLEAVVEAMFESARQNNFSEVIERDLEFHQLIWQIADHQRLKQVLEGLRLQITMYLTVNTQLYEDLATGIADHRVILEAIRSRDKEVAAATMATHLEYAAGLVMDFVHKRDERREEKSDIPDPVLAA